MAIFVEPLDVWVFRDGRPFSAGEDHHAKSVFPPSPFTVQGALRSKVLTERCGNLEKYAGRNGASSCPVCGDAAECPLRAEVGTPTDPKPFRLRHVLPARERDGSPLNYFPLPRHVVFLKGTEQAKFLRLLVDRDYTGLPAGLQPLGVFDAQPVEYRETWVDAETLEKLLHGDVSVFDGLRRVPTRGPEGILEEESRVGIALQRGRKTSESGKFFIVDALRLHESWGLSLGFDGLFSLPKQGFLDIGGEGRAGRYRSITDVVWPAHPKVEDIARDRQFLIYFVSPTFFGGNDSPWTWKPSFLKNGLDGTLPGSATTVRLVAAAVGPALRISGWELGGGDRGGRPRPMRPAVPAGSVYFFELVSGRTEDVAALHATNLADWGTEFGFGLALIGRW